MGYDKNNIFAKILRGEIPCSKICENEHALAFHDINPQAPKHALVIPKGEYMTYSEFAARAGAEEIAAWMQLTQETVQLLNLNKTGYRLLINNGEDANQEVPHLHLHIVGGAPLGRMLPG